MCAQKQGNIWYFGDHAGFDFSDGTPQQITGGQVHYVDGHQEGSAVIADSSGALLFYSDGRQAWNRFHQLMPHGDSLMSNASATQSALIVPRPGSDHLFYLFTVDDFHFDSLANGFRYSVVDMCRDAGLGDVVREEKNILLLDTVAEKQTAVRHANGQDYWVIVHKFYSDAFYAYPVTDNGIGSPVVSHTGSMHPPVGFGSGAAIGQLKASPDGHKLAIVCANSNENVAEYLAFDNSTGTVSDPVSLQLNPVWNCYGASFSPDNSKLYISSSLNGNGVYQFDLTAGGGDPDAVALSRVQVASGGNFLGMQLAVDGKIYVVRSPFLNNPFVDVINAPNTAGAGCDYVGSAIDLSPDYASFSLPSFIDSYDYSNTMPDCLAMSVSDNDPQDARIQPNPMTEACLISLMPDCRSLSILAANGQIVRRIENFGGSAVRIERNELKAGAYFVRMIDVHGGSRTLPLMIGEQ